MFLILAVAALLFGLIRDVSGKGEEAAPTILRLTLSFLSRLLTSESTDILHSNVAPDVTSMRLSIPTRETFAANTPAVIFQ
jgi:hypothetical protein